MEVQVYFSDFFQVDDELIEKYGAVNISLINDLPLFIDPFLLFNSENPDYQRIHEEMIDYLLFLKRESEKNFGELPSGMRKAWYSFPEVKQTWLGFSLSGNAGCGMGIDFASGLHEGLNSLFNNFGNETITKGKHMEKLCLISPHVGRDKISDFTTNFAKKYLLDYTQNFAKKYLPQNKCKLFSVSKAYFSWDTKVWVTAKYLLPCYNNDYVLLTPKDMLTRDDTFINRRDMLHNLEEIAPSIPDDALRFELESYFTNVLSKGREKLTRKEKESIAINLIRSHPELIDYYVRHKEDNETEATSVSKEKVGEVQQLFNEQIGQLVQLLNKETEFYSTQPDAYDEAKKRIEYLRHVIENQDGYKLFYIKGEPIKREADLQVIFRLVWFGSPMDVNREVNNGRGPVDYKISYGANNSVLVEFKLASNSKLRQNINKQVEVYKAASDTANAIKVIMFFSEQEEAKVTKILKELDLLGHDDIVLIDARSDNKISASNVRQ